MTYGFVVIAVPIALAKPRGNGGEYVFDGRIDLPPEGQRNGWGVLVIGGGMGSDLDSTVPGSMARIVGGPITDRKVLIGSLIPSGPASGLGG